MAKQPDHRLSDGIRRRVADSAVDEKLIAHGRGRREIDHAPAHRRRVVQAARICATERKSRQRRSLLFQVCRKRECPLKGADRLVHAASAPAKIAREDPYTRRGWVSQFGGVQPRFPAASMSSYRRYRAARSGNEEGVMRLTLHHGWTHRHSRAQSPCPQARTLAAQGKAAHMGFSEPRPLNGAQSAVRGANTLAARAA